MREHHRYITYPLSHLILNLVYAMDIEKEKVYRAWPSGPPTYQQATSEYVQGITHNRQWNYSLFSCFEPGSLCTYLS